MSILKIGKCAVCGKLVELLPSNNPIAAGVCLDCLAKQINPKNLEQANFFCRTFNIPFNPTKWTELQGRLGSNKQIFAAYMELWVEENPTTPVMWAEGHTKDLWTEINNEWELAYSRASIQDIAVQRVSLPRVLMVYIFFSSLVESSFKSR